jgi:hypothetical protein
MQMQFVFIPCLTMVQSCKLFCIPEQKLNLVPASIISGALFLKVFYVPLFISKKLPKYCTY